MMKGVLRPGRHDKCIYAEQKCIYAEQKRAEKNGRPDHSLLLSEQGGKAYGRRPLCAAEPEYQAS